MALGVAAGAIGTAILATGAGGTAAISGVPFDVPAQSGKNIPKTLAANLAAIATQPATLAKVATPLIAGAVVPPLLERLPLVGGAVKSAKRRLKGITG